MGDITKPLLIAGLSIGRQMRRIPRKGPNTTIGAWRANPKNNPMSRSRIAKVGLASMAAVVGVGVAVSGGVALSRIAKSKTKPVDTHDRAYKRTIKRYGSKVKLLRGVL